MQQSFFLQPPLGAARRATSRLRATISLAALGLTALLVLGLSSPAAHAQAYNEQTLHSFGSSNSDGQNPFPNLIDVNGIFYGTTNGGGNDRAGTIFSIDPTTNTETTLYSFNPSNGVDGARPQAGLIDVNGIFYGTTSEGGTFAQGTVFSFDPTTNTETILHSFLGDPSDGSSPQTSLLDVNGILYGTTAYDGVRNTTSGQGTVFSINTNGTGYQIIHTFTGTNGDGAILYSGLTYDSAGGKIYGTTDFGGAHNGLDGGGTIFSIDATTNAYNTMYRFLGLDNGDGAGPHALLDVNGTLYGTTQYGGTHQNAQGNGDGTLFSFDPSTNMLTTLYNFHGLDNGDGATPNDLLDVNGILYGTTFAGGNRNTPSDTYGNGTVFSYDLTTSIETPLYRFTTTDTNRHNADGQYPGGLLDVNGTLYGTTDTGGLFGDGTVFSLTPAPPVAANDRYAPLYSTPYAVRAPGVLANDNNNGFGSLTAALVSNVSQGTLTFNSDGSFTYVPNAGFVGTDTFTYQASNTAGTSNIATVSLVIQTSAPIAHNDGYAPRRSIPYVVKAPGVLANDFNGDNQSMTAALVTNVTHGTLTLNSDGSFTYTSSAGFVGTDSFTYQATNPIGTSNTATVTLNVQAPPTAANDRYAPLYQTPYAVQAPGVLANDGNGGSTPITASLVSSPGHGSLTFNTDGSFLYTPAAGFVGTDSFTYQAVNSVGTSNIATVSLVVQASAPVAHNDAYTVKHNTFFAVRAPGVLANDYAGDNQPMTATLVTSTTNGSLTFNSDGSFSYTPNAGFSGTDTFTYQAVNPIGTSNTATVTLNVQ